MEVSFKHANTESHIEEEDYFPLIVRFSSESLNEEYYQITAYPTDLLEFEVDGTTGKNNLMKLVLCRHYKTVEKSLLPPKAESGELYFSGSDLFKYGSSEQSVDRFEMQIYLDGVKFSFSAEHPFQHVRTGSVVFGLSKTNKLIEIYVPEMSATELEHLRNELEN